MSGYRKDLAWIHDTGFSGFAIKAAPAVRAPEAEAASAPEVAHSSLGLGSFPVMRWRPRGKDTTSCISLPRMDRLYTYR